MELPQEHQATAGFTMAHRHIAIPGWFIQITGMRLYYGHPALKSALPACLSDGFARKELDSPWRREILSPASLLATRKIIPTPRYQGAEIQQGGQK